MPQSVIKAGSYVLFPDLVSVRQQYSDGQIKGLKTDKLGQLLNVPAVQPRDNSLLEWAFGAHADVIGNLPTCEHATFCQLFKANRSIPLNLDGTPNLSGEGVISITYPLPKLFSGVKGNGNYEPLMPGLYQRTRDDTLLQQLTEIEPSWLLTPNQSFPALEQQSFGWRGNFFRPLVNLSAPLPPAYRVPTPPPVISPKAVHICELRGSMSGFFADVGNEAEAFRMLDQLPLDKADEHARLSLSTALLICGGLPESFTLASLMHPRILPPWVITPASAERRYNVAFTSSTLLGLGQGDIVFISNSFKDEVLYPGLPTSTAVFDLAVYQVTQWLERRGVTVIFSAGGSGTDSSDLAALLRTTESSILGVSSLPGIVVGGLSPDQQTITSNYGTQVTCYLPPLLNQTSFAQSSSATAQVAGGVMRLQRCAMRLKRRWLTPGEIRSLLANSASRRCRTPQNTNVPVRIPDWPLLEAAVDRL